MTRRRALVYAALALAVPLPALALERGGSGGSLDVQASLGGCGVADASITCRIDVAFSGVPDADYYTASVTAPDGSVLELGRIASSGDGGASTSASVPFAGNGEYTVTVSAWGYDERGRPDVVESGHSAARNSESKSAGELEAAAPEPATTPEEEPASEQEPATAPGLEQPACPEPAAPAEPPEPPEPPEPAQGDPAAEEPAPAAAGAEAGGATVAACEQAPEPEPPPVP